MKLTYRPLTIGMVLLGILFPFVPAFASLAFAQTASSFVITSISATCVAGVPRVTASWTPETGAARYFLERRFPDSTTFEVTGASFATSHVDATWLPGYAPGTYAYRVRGIGVTAPVTVAIPDCTSVAASPAPAPAPAPAPVTTCSYPNWIGGQQYPAGAIVKYTDGKFYRAKFANPGYDPVISYYFWEVTSCGGGAATTVASAPTLVAGQAIPLPSRVVSTYSPLWSGLRITSIPTSYNQIYLFHATPNANGSGAFVFEYGNAVNSSEIQTVRSRGQRVVLTAGGANAGFNFQTRTQSQNFVNSIYAIVGELGQIDGIDFNNFEAGIAPSATEMIWIAGQLKARYGSNFSVSSPPAPWSAQDLNLSIAMVNAGVLDYAGPQFYDGAGLSSPSVIIDYVDQWVKALGDPSKVVVGFGSNYAAGSNMAQVNEAWTTIAQKYLTIRGAFGWSASDDSNAGWTFGTYFQNNV